MDVEDDEHEYQRWTHVRVNQYHTHDHAHKTIWFNRILWRMKPKEDRKKSSQS